MVYTENVIPFSASPAITMTQQLPSCKNLTWQITHEFLKKMKGAWPFENKKEVKVNYIKEEYESKETEEEKKEVLLSHSEFIKSRKWEDMNDPEIIIELMKRFPDIFAEKLNKDRKIKGEAIQVAIQA